MLYVLYVAYILILKSKVPVWCSSGVPDQSLNPLYIFLSVTLKHLICNGISQGEAQNPDHQNTFMSRVVNSSMVQVQGKSRGCNRRLIQLQFQ